MVKHQSLGVILFLNRMTVDLKEIKKSMVPYLNVWVNLILVFSCLDTAAFYRKA